MVGVIFVEMYGVWQFIAKVNRVGPYALFLFILAGTPVCIRRYGLGVTALALAACVVTIGLIKLIVYAIQAVHVLVS
jgi:hypothetical protein